MKRNYRLTPPSYEFVRSEERYAQMAQKGWLLERRGRAFERYRRGEPESRQYRLEFRPRKAFEGVVEMDEEELAVYRDCGWELVSGESGVYVFSGTEQLRDAELYTDKEGQLAFLKRSRNYLGGAGVTWAALVGVYLARFFTGGGNLLSAGGLFGGDWLFLLVMATFCYSLWLSVYGWYRCRRLVRLAKRGVSLRSEKANPRFYAGKAVSRLLGFWEDVCLVGAVILMCTMTTTPLPQAGEGAPYLLLGETFEGRRLTAEEGFLRKDGSVRTMRGLLSDNYRTEEGFRLENGEDYYLWQEVYDLRFGDFLAKELADSLLRNAAFHKDGEEKVIPHEGFDYVAVCPEALAAVKGNRVACFSGAVLDPGGENREALLSALLKKWN